MTRITLTLKEGTRLEIRCKESGLREDRELTEDDFETFERWAGSYGAAVERRADPETFLEIGREILKWLDGGERWFSRIRDGVEAPLLCEFSAGRDPDDEARKFLDAPWELAADENVPLAWREDMAYCPVRRLGRRGRGKAPSEHNLSIVFMAAAPREMDNLHYEREESAIIAATRIAGLELTVEDSGTLPLLRACVAREKPVDVIHISCHGRLEPEPHLLLEDELGDARPTSALELTRELAAHPARLLFLSACETAKADQLLSSLSWSLVRSVAPAVLGWAGSVGDGEATRFAEILYRRLADGEPLAEAVAWARLELGSPPPGGLALGKRSQDWHLARLYLGPSGGGVLATGQKGRRHLQRGFAYKAFLNRKKQEVPVAGELEFVGRRRELQTVLREFNEREERRKAGVFIHGVGRQGKSSLAARVAHRLEARDYDVLVLHGRYDAPAVLQAFHEFASRPGVEELVKAHLPSLDEDPARLETALRELLEGPCCQLSREADGTMTRRPVLLVIDDFEQALEGQPEEGRHRVKADYVESVRAVIRAFEHARTDSRLLFTSRVQFTLPDDGRDLWDLLYDLPLPPMKAYESKKQAIAKLAVVEEVEPDDVAEAEKRTETIIDTGKGNPGLQDWLFRLALEDAETCDRCLSDMREFLEEGKKPSEAEVLAFLERLALESLVGLLSPSQRELLRVSTLFQLPVPESVLAKLAGECGLGGAGEDLERLVALGLWDVYENPFRRRDRALLIDPIVRPFAGALTEKEEEELAKAVVRELFGAWGGTKGGKKRSYLHDYELTRLGLKARDAEVLACTAADAVEWLGSQFVYREAAALGEEAIACLEESNHEVPWGLFLQTAEYDGYIGETDRALQHVEDAVTGLREAKRAGEEFDDVGLGAALVAHGRLLVDRGRLDEALPEFEEARSLLGGDRERAILLGDVAQIKVAKGEVDQALKFHQERLSILEGLGDKHSRAATLAEIARIRAYQGEVNEAFRLQQEMLAIFEALGDRRSRAVALGDIAEVELAKGAVEEALSLHQERLGIFEALGDKGEIAQTLWCMARVELTQQKYQEAFEHLAKSYAINLKLGRVDGICYVGRDFGHALCAAGEREKGLEILNRSREGFQKLGREDLASQVQAIIDKIEKGDG